MFLLFQWLGLVGTLTPIVITHLVLTVPIVVWIMVGFFEGLPGGAAGGRAGRFSWNNFLFGVVLANRETRTLPVAVYNMLTFEQVSWGPLAAAALVVTAPVLLLTLFMQKDILTGLTAGGVKGG